MEHPLETVSETPNPVNLFNSDVTVSVSFLLYIIINNRGSENYEN